MGDDGFLDIDLPDAHHGNAVFGNPVCGDQPVVDGKRAYRRGQVAAVAAPVDERLVDGHLAEQVIHVVVCTVALGQNHRLAGTRGGAAHAVGVFAIGVRAADDPQQQLVAGFAGHLGHVWQIGEAEENAFAGAATHVSGRDFDLGYMGHGAFLFCWLCAS